MASASVAPLQPVRFTVDTVSVRANPDFKPLPKRSLLPQVDMSVQLVEGTNEHNERLYEYRLKINARPQAAATPLPYFAELTVIGVFAPIDDAQVEEVAFRRMVAFNGLALLYGFARDLVVHNTALGVHGPFILPALNLTSLANDLLQSAESIDEAPAASVDPAETDEKRPARKQRRRPARKA